MVVYQRCQRRLLAKKASVSCVACSSRYLIGLGFVIDAVMNASSELHIPLLFMNSYSHLWSGTRCGSEALNATTRVLFARHVYRVFVDTDIAETRPTNTSYTTVPGSGAHTSYITA